VEFAQKAFGTSSIEALRAKSAQEIMDAALKPPRSRFYPNIDGYFLPEDGRAIFAAGKQSHVPLLAGWNRDEGSFRAFFGDDQPSVETYVARAKAKFGSDAETFLKLYPAATDAQAKRSGQDLAGDQFMGYNTWKWMEEHLKTGGSSIFRYKFDHTLPLPKNAAPGLEPTAPHACDIEYVFQMLPARDLPWRTEDQQLSELISSYWTNFAKTGNPNGPGLPRWPEYNSRDGYPVMRLDATSSAAPDKQRERYEFLDRLNSAR
jgi:para-nitrobenzyl esterase